MLWHVKFENVIANRRPGHQVNKVDGLTGTQALGIQFLSVTRQIFGKKSLVCWANTALPYHSFDWFLQNMRNWLANPSLSLQKVYYYVYNRKTPLVY